MGSGRAKLERRIARLEHKMLPPSRHDPEANKWAEIRALVAHIKDQAQLDRIIEKFPPEHQRSMYERYKPFLKFEAADFDPIADCSKCGFRRGSVMEHTCVVAANEAV